MWRVTATTHQFHQLTSRGLFVLVILTCITSPSGYGKPLGEHSDPRGVTLAGKFSHPGVFYEHFLKPGHPLWMKTAMKLAEFPCMTKWSDDYFREHLGQDKVMVEISRKEDRTRKQVWMPMIEFLKQYRNEELYLVQSVPDILRGDLYMPGTLHCGGFQQVVHDVVMWLSGGGTRSVLHRDELDNIICVINGTKDIFLIDKLHKNLVEAVGFVEDGGYSTVDVDDVDEKKFSKLLSAPWHKIFLGPGDCAYIPYRWYHQINSHGNRSMAVNFWFSHLWWFDYDDCLHPDQFNQTKPLSSYSMANPNEVVRFQLLEVLSSLPEVEEEDLNDVFPETDPEELTKLFKFIDNDRDGQLTWKELYQFSIDEAVQKFSVFFGKLSMTPNINKPKRKTQSSSTQHAGVANGSKVKDREDYQSPTVNLSVRRVEKKKSNGVHGGDNKMATDAVTEDKTKVEEVQEIREETVIEVPIMTIPDSGQETVNIEKKTSEMQDMKETEADVKDGEERVSVNDKVDEGFEDKKSDHTTASQDTISDSNSADVKTPKHDEF